MFIQVSPSFESRQSQYRQSVSAPGRPDHSTSTVACLPSPWIGHQRRQPDYSAILGHLQRHVFAHKPDDLRLSPSDRSVTQHQKGLMIAITAGVIAGANSCLSTSCLIGWAVLGAGSRPVAQRALTRFCVTYGVSNGLAWFFIRLKARHEALRQSTVDGQGWRGNDAGLEQPVPVLSSAQDSPQTRRPSTVCDRGEKRWLYS